MKITRLTALCATTLVTTLSAGVAHAVPVAITSTFTLYDSLGNIAGTDTSVTGFIDNDAGTFSLASTTPFFGLTWATHDGVLYGPGNYNISTYDTFGNTCTASYSICAGDGVTDIFGPQNINFVVPNGYLGGHIKFAWNTTDGMDVFLLWDANGNSVDVDGDGIPGMAMVDGPFFGFSPSFNVSYVPLPAGAWLFGSGLLALVGTARRKTS